MPLNKGEKQTISVLEFARAVGVGKNLAYEAVASGSVKSIRLGKRYLIPRAELQRLLSAQETKAA